MTDTIDKIPWIPSYRHKRAVTYTTSDGVTVTVFPPNDLPRLYRVVIYCRVSTTHADQLASLNEQLEYFRDYVHRHRAWILIGEYVDTKSARSINARAQFEKMISDCMEGKIDIIITKTVSRFGRNTVDTLSILRKLKEKNVDVFFENEGLHSNDGNDELLISLMATVAQAESENRSNNIKWGIKRHAKNPDAAIYSRPCYGYRKTANGCLAIHEEEAKVVRMIFDLYLSGASILSIKRQMENMGIKTPTGKDIWPKRSIETMLSNEKYAGDVLIYKTYCAEYPDKRRIQNKGQRERFVIYGNHEAIISKEQFEMVQLEKRRRTNIVIGDDGTPKRKKTHYSMKSKATNRPDASDESRDSAQ